MSYGVQVFNSDGTVIYDSSTVLGGVIADIETVPAGTSKVFTYPSFVGRTPFLIGDLQAVSSALVDMTLGYPRVTVSSKSYAQRFILAIL